jgi:hypothetical protein
MGRALTQEKFLARAKKTHKNVYDYSKTQYIPGNKKVEIGCKLHGIFFQYPLNHIKGQGCPKCGRDRTYNSNKRPITKKEFVKKAVKIHSDKYDYSKVESIVYGTQKIIIICKKHGEFLQSPTRHICTKQGCFKCARELTGNKARKPQEDFIKEAKLKHSNKYDYSKVNYIKNSEKIIIICKKHGEFLQTPLVHLQGNGNNIGCGCPECNNSHGIDRVIQWLIKKLDLKEKNFLKNV